jgi:hypothetical protein
MTNFSASIKLNVSLVCLAAALCLQGCGGERTTAFNPGSSSSNSSSSVAKIESSLLKEGTVSNYDLLDHKEKSLNVISEYTEYTHLIDQYTDDTPNTPDFDAGQLVLVDMGNTKGCDRHLSFSSLSAQEYGDSAVKVVVKYNERAENRTDCSNTTTRPYYFYYVKKRGLVVFEEIIL